MKLIRQDGEVIDVEIGSVSINYDGRLANLTIFDDVTERKKSEKELAESKERYQKLVNLSPEPIVVHSQGIVQYINGAGVRILSFNHHKELIGKSILDFYHPNYLKKAIERIQLFQQGNSSQVELL